MEKWAAESFVFSEWKGRGINVLKGTGTIVEELEEAQVCPLSTCTYSYIVLCDACFLTYGIPINKSLNEGFDIKPAQYVTLAHIRHPPPYPISNPSFGPFVCADEPADDAFDEARDPLPRGGPERAAGPQRHFRQPRAMVRGRRK